MKKMIVSMMLIISMFAFAAESLPSNTVGYVRYDRTLNRTFVALPMQGTFVNASDFGVATGNQINAVSRYDSGVQGWITASKTFLGWQDDFAVVAGQPYWVNSTAAGTFISDGAVVGNPAYNLVLNRNGVMVPLDKSSMTMASHYGTETGNVINTVSRYDSGVQGWISASKTFLGWQDDFAIAIAEPHWVNATSALSWPSKSIEIVEGEIYEPTSPKADPKTFNLGMLDPDGAEYTEVTIAPVTFKAWFTERPLEVIDHTGIGCATEMYFGVRGISKVDLQNFATPYAVGNELNVLMKDEREGTHTKVFYESLAQYTLTEIGGGAVELGFEDMGLAGSGMPFVLNTPSSVESNLPTVTKLHQNYPNPFNPTTTIKFDLASDSNVRLNVFNYNGQLMHSLVEGRMNAGAHTVEFDAANLSAGVYFYALETENNVFTNKMILVK